MKLFATSAAALALVAAPMAASAVELSYGYQANAMFPEDGDTYYSGEGYIEGTASGVTLGLWAGTTDIDESVDFEISLGYGWEFATGVTLDATATGYTNSEDGYDDTDVNLELGFPVSDPFAIYAGATYLIDAEDWDVYAGAVYSFGDFAVTGEVGDDGTTYWSLEGAYAFTDNVWASAEYADADGSDYEVTVSVGYDF
ncbi:outer membrane beta-barrel protein [Aliiroseovarius sp. PTFE2010]|uniref:outer membrane beta-barrel protein n=1 Tax=Aliiroseovarius sp. PTFE2010 TaxID=3417190 RepID=UPI003CF997E5